MNILIKPVIIIRKTICFADMLIEPKIFGTLLPNITPLPNDIVTVNGGGGVICSALYDDLTSAGYYNMKDPDFRQRRRNQIRNNYR